MKLVKRFLLMLLLLSPAPLLAQASCQTNGMGQCSTTMGSLQVRVTFGLTFDLALSSTVTNLPAPDAAAFNTGYTLTNGPVATIRSNGPWALSISASSATWAAVNTVPEPARTDKPASDLSWSTDPGGVFTDLSTSPMQVASGLATAGTMVPLFYRTVYQWALDTPGNYSLQIVFTIAAP